LFSNDGKGLRGKIEALVKILRDSPPGTDELAKTIANEAEYF